jgi:hypothetical protein
MKLYANSAEAHLYVNISELRIFSLAIIPVLAVIAIPVSVPDTLAQGAESSINPGITSPVLKDQQGNILSQGSEGQILVLSTTAANSVDEPLQFVAVIESRDENDMTQFLGFSIGRLEANTQSEIGISWTPENAGDYQLRAFLLSGFPNPQILSTIQTSDVVIIE